MKTFCRTTLFRIVVAIAFLIVSGFGYHSWRLPAAFDQSYLAERLPNQVTEQIFWQGSLNGRDQCMGDPQEIDDPATIIETDGISNITTLPAALPQAFEQADLSELRIDIAGLSQQIEEQFSMLSKQITNLSFSCPVDFPYGNVSIDPNAQKKAELQAQIESLQMEL